MPFLRQALLVFHATVMATFLVLSFGPGLGCASPTPASLPLSPADYSFMKLARSLFIRDTSLITTSDMKYPTSSRPVQPRRPQLGGGVYSNPPTSANRLDSRLLDSYTTIQKNCNAATYKASNLREFVSKSPPGAINNQDFLDTCSEQLKDLSGIVTNLRAEFQRPGAQKGLAFYDDSSDVQTEIKNVFNSVKDLLNLMNDLFGDSFLSNLVYDLKCVVDEVLNIVENATDEVLSALDV